jgi:hypothetical protein
VVPTVDVAVFVFFGAREEGVLLVVAFLLVPVAGFGSIVFLVSVFLFVSGFFVIPVAFAFVSAFGFGPGASLLSLWSRPPSWLPVFFRPSSWLSF